MIEENEENKNNIYELNMEQKPIEAFKDNIKKENISDIKIKNQSMNNNTNSYSKSFESEKNDNNKEKELINNIKVKNNNNNYNNYSKDSKFKRKKEEIKMLIFDNKDKYLNKQRKDDLIQRANKMPEFESHSKKSFSNTLKKIKNKSIEKKAKDLLNNNKKEISNEKESNKFIKKLKEIEIKIEEIKNNKNITKKNNEENKIEYNIYKENSDNKKKNDDNNNFIDFKFNISKPSGDSENRYQELKKLYYNNKFDFIPLKNKSTRDNSKNKENNNKRKNYPNTYEKKEEYKGKFINYNIQKLNKKNQNQNMIRLINSKENFNNILDKLGKLEENKIDDKYRISYIYNNNKYSNELNKENKHRYINKSDFGIYKSVSLEKTSKLKNMMIDVYSEIKDITDHPMKRNFSHKISNMKANIKYSILTRKDEDLKLNHNFLINDYRYNKSNDLNFDDLLKLCSKRNLKSFIKNTKFSF